MKTLLNAITLTSILFFPTSVLGAMMVNDVRGNAFVSQNAHTDLIRVGDHIPEGAEVFTEERGQVSLSDYYDHKYHLSSSTHLKIMKKKIELRGGVLWYQSFAKGGRDSHLFQIQTANAKVKYDQGEAILSFNPSSGKSQLLVIKGYNLFSNRHKIGQELEVKGGSFSFIQNNQENGNPRLPTPISLKSYKRITTLFNGIQPTDILTIKKLKPFSGKRKIASVAVPAIDPIFPTPTKAKAEKEQPCPPCPCSLPQEKHQKTSLNRPRSRPVSVYIYRPRDKNHSKEKEYSPLPHSPLAPQVRKTPTPTKQAKSKKQIYARPKIIFRKTAQTPKRKKQKGRNPASIPPLRIAPKAKSNPFEAALKKEYQKQARHDKQVNELIDALKSIDMDYRKGH